MPTIRLVPHNTVIPATAGANLGDLLWPHGVEFPCGGRGTCKGCRVQVVAGSAPVDPHDRKAFNEAQLTAGWRLACRIRLDGDLTLQLAQWTATILADDREVAVQPREGLGIAIDLGSTTLVAQLVDRRDGRVLGVRTALNPQARHGADLMSRIQFATRRATGASGSSGSRGDGATVLRDLVRNELGRLVSELMPLGGDAPLKRITVVGNTAMHHLFCGVDLTPLAGHPFEAVDDGLKTFRGSDLGWTAAASAEVHFLPCLGGFVGSDILAGILATGLHTTDQPTVLVDLGTNGEIVVGDRHGMYCASTAAGPAFEGASISCGMRAMTGAVNTVTVVDGGFRCTVLGGAAPRGVCGSGLVDAVACGLDLHLIERRGRVATADRRLPLVDGVALVQQDVRELQLAKGAIAAGIELLLRQKGWTAERIHVLQLAGAFGNYINRSAAHRIGLLPLPAERVHPAGNTALLGARLALFDDDLEYAGLRARCTHVALKADPAFEDTYVGHMAYP